MKEKLNQFKAEFAKEIFKKADEGAISKEVALDLLTVYDLLPVAPWMLIGMIVGLVALFTCPVLMAECFCLALFFITIDRYYEIKDEKNGNR